MKLKDLLYRSTALNASPRDVTRLHEASPALLDVVEGARLVSQWHSSIGSGPIEVLDAELGDLKAALAALDEAVNLQPSNETR